jgi:hypothetical protein
VLVIVRPSTLTWGFFLYAAGSVPYSIVLLEYLPQRIVDAVTLYDPYAQILSAFGFAVFALLFPKDRASGWHRRVLYALTAIMLVAIAVSAYVTSMFFSELPSWKLANASFNTPRLVYTIGMYSLGVAFFAINYLMARPAERPRLRWVMIGFILGYAGTIVIGIMQGAFAVSPPVWIFNILATFSVLAPMSVAYAIMKHRVIDVRFFLSRALVYGLLTTLAVAVLALLDWAVARQLEQSNLGILVEIAGAVLVGLGIHRVHGAIDGFVDRFVFRSVHDAEQHFTTVGRAMMYAQSTRAIDVLLTEESTRALHLTGSAVYHAHENGGFAKTSASGSIVRDGFDHDDRVVLHLLAERTPIEIDGQLAVPFTVRDRLLGLALFGAHTNATAIDPNERELLERFCHSASNAYDHVMGEERADENQRLRGELALLQARYEEVRSIVSSPRDTLEPM